MDHTGLLCAEALESPAIYGITQPHDGSWRATVPSLYQPCGQSDVSDDTLDFMLQEEGKSIAAASYLDTVQGGNIKDWMRAQLVQWVAELCEWCKLTCLGLAVNLLDRYLSAGPVSCSRLQCAAGAALLVASKLRDESSVTAHAIWTFADHAFTYENLLQQEHVLVCTLQWRVQSVTCDEIVDHLLRQIGMAGAQWAALWDHATLLLDLSYQDYCFVGCPPSVLSCAAISLALELSNDPDTHQYTSQLQARTKITNERLCAYQVCRERLWVHFATFLESSNGSTPQHQMEGKHTNSMEVDAMVCGPPRESPISVMDGGVFTFDAPAGSNHLCQ